jgi:hypothetical protein
MNKKIIFAAFVLITILFAVPVLAQNATFRDVPTSHFAFEAINWVSNPENGAFMVGDMGNNFHPQRNLNKFEAAQIFALAAGFRHVTHNLPAEEREELSRSFETWRPFLDTMAEEFSSWNRTADREISFLLERGIITMAEVQNFVTRDNGTESRPLITRQEAVAWMVRLVGQSAQAQAVTLPHPVPFRDDAAITPGFRRYVYHARELGIIRGDASGNMNPTAHFTRAEMATVFHNALANTPAASAPVAGGVPATISGTIANVHLDTHVSITSAAGTDTFSIAPNAVIMIDNTQRTAAFLREGMTVTVLVDAQRRIISLVARSQGAGAGVSSSEVTPSQTAALYSDEGFVTATNATLQTVTIRTHRVRISGQIIDDERTFTFAQNAVITHGGENASFADIQVGDIAFFGFNENVIHNLELMERERTILGILTDVRVDNNGDNPTLIITETEGRSYELRALSTTTFSRGYLANLSVNDLRIGDAITAEVELDRLIHVHAVGERIVVEGRLTQILITERNHEITITHESGISATYIVRPNVIDIYSLRVGTFLRINLDSREAIFIHRI